MECLIICMMVFLILRQTECLLLFFFNLKKPKGKQVNKQYGSKFNIEIKLEIFWDISLLRNEKSLILMD